MYRAPLPRTKLLSPLPAARFERLAARRTAAAIAVDGWRGMVGHNWGAEHAERWIWLHALTEAGDWLDAAIGKVQARAGRRRPWVANGAALARAASATRSAASGASVEVREAPDGCDFILPGAGLARARRRVAAPRKDFVGWVYADPAGPEHNTVNCSMADMTLRVRARRRAAARARRSRGGAAYELGMRETRPRHPDPAVPGRLGPEALDPPAAAPRGGSGSGRAGGWGGAARTPRPPARAGSRPSRRAPAGLRRVVRVELGHALLEPLAALDRLALGRRERAQLAVARAAAGVRLGLGARHAAHGALDAHLAPQRAPVEQERGARVGLELAGLAAAVVGEERRSRARRSPW